VKSCGELNALTLSLENIKSLNGFCYEDGSLTVCEMRHMGNPSFDVSAKGLDSTWRCRVQNIEGKIKAVPYFQYD